ncbi:anti-sigma factor family protein [Actinopolymorpha singaporensis]|uniref:Putative zinc-finger n=1 Tax=Actinopolymorpha singaporensis TaxID=117157 RepID=A0A1H1YT80_9ACTN|nr:zf-HC2 domain-containing protein [Actinopolymorpha singaporensis]SDT24641.1 Putative zinc-finger [Actinopolymorpha singaporensis]
MTHDRAVLSALVDGELDHEARDRALAHLAHCAECRDAVDAERRVKSLLSGMSAPTPSAFLEAGLRALAEPVGVVGEDASRQPLGPGVSATTGGFARTPIQAGVRGPIRAPRPGPPTAHRPPGQPGTRRPRRGGHPAGRSRRRLTVGVAGAAAMATMTFVVAFAAGGQPKQPPVSVVPPVQRYAVDHAGSAAEVPLSDPGAATASFDRGLLAPAAGR